MLEVRREHIFRDRTNPLEIYDDLELIERFRYNETSVFALAHAYIVVEIIGTLLHLPFNIIFTHPW
jgi:hypothetical protein